MHTIKEKYNCKYNPNPKQAPPNIGEQTEALTNSVHSLKINKTLINIT